MSDAYLGLRIVAPGDLDSAAGELPWVRFERRDGGLFAACPSDLAARARIALARAGLASTATSASDAARLRPAIVSHLAPLALDGAADIVHVRRPPLGEAIALLRASTHDLLRRRSRGRRDRMRALLREDERLLAWRRVIWAPTYVLRGARLAGVRPAVFDRDAATHARERLLWTGDRALTRWAGA